MKLLDFSAITGLVIALSACGGDDPGLPRVSAGEGIGGVTLGMRYADLRTLLGEPSAAITVTRQSILMFDEAGLEAVLASSEDSAVSDDAYVLGVSAMDEGFTGPHPGQTRAEIEAALGAPDFEEAGVAFWTEGMSVVWSPEGNARQVAVFAPFTIETEMPEMQPALGGAR
ncbi:MAG: hypothetical protein H6722_06715 [Sandaracinus sp.]|nr:hypothetical protein [Sandaracinus sp.]